MEHTRYYHPSWHVLILSKLHLTYFWRCSMSWVLFQEQDCGCRKYIFIGMTAICLKQQMQGKNPCNWQQIKKASCNLGCSSLWQNRLFGVCVNFKAVLEEASELDRLHTPKLIHNILLNGLVKSIDMLIIIFKMSALWHYLCWQKIFFLFCTYWKQLRHFCVSDWTEKVVSWNHALFLPNLSQLPNR